VDQEGGNGHQVNVDLFDFALPPERIALYPASPRDSARCSVAPIRASPRVPSN
jgi:hypothetical protein